MGFSFKLPDWLHLPFGLGQDQDEGATQTRQQAGGRGSGRGGGRGNAAALSRASNPESAASTLPDGPLTRLELARGILQAKGRVKMGAAARDVAQEALAAGLFSDANNLDLAREATRAEGVKMMAVAFGWQTLAANEVKQVFSDLPSAHWSAPYVYGALKARLLSGYEDRTFKPDASITGADAKGMFKWAAAGEGQATYRFDPTQAGGVEAILGTEGSESRTNRAQSLDREGRTTRDTGAAEDAQAQSTIDIAEALNPEGNARYRATSTSTFCNVFAHDYAWLMGAFLPRMWWNDPEKVFADMQAGKETAIDYGGNSHEVRANELHTWMAGWGPRFGWAGLGEPTNETLQQAQEYANRGAVVVVTASTGNASSGHIVAIIAESGDQKATWKGDRYLPVQAEAGAANNNGWNNDYMYKQFYGGGKGVWVHG